MEDEHSDARVVRDEAWATPLTEIPDLPRAQFPLMRNAVNWQNCYINNSSVLPDDFRPLLSSKLICSLFACNWKRKWKAKARVNTFSLTRDVGK